MRDTTSYFPRVSPFLFCQAVCIFFSYSPLHEGPTSRKILMIRNQTVLLLSKQKAFGEVMKLLLTHWLKQRTHSEHGRNNKLDFTRVILRYMMICCDAHTSSTRALCYFSLNSESDEILIRYTGGFDVSKAEYCSARHRMFYWNTQCSTQGEWTK